MTRSEETRDERDAFVRGEARYISDIVDRGDFLHGMFIRSPVAHARLASIDMTAVNDSPGVVALLTHADVADLTIPGRLRPNMADATGMERKVLADATVRYVGEPVALVVGESEQAVRDAAENAVIVYDELPVAVTADDAIAGGVIIFPGTGSNVVEHFVVDEFLNSGPSDVEVTVEVAHPRIAAVPMETVGCISIPGQPLNFICGHQNPNGLRRDLAGVMTLSTDDIRVQVPDIGGSFGSKGPFYPEYAAIVRASQLLSRPVAWRQSRSENLQTSGHGRSQTHVVRVQGTTDGRITGLDISILADLGAYPSMGSFVPRTTVLCAPGPYDVRNVRIEMTSVVTNTAPVGQYRGAGRPEAALSLETALDVFAAKVGKDPVSIRRANLIKSSQMPFTSATGAVYDGGDYNLALDRLVQLLDASGVQPSKERSNGSRWRYGVGIAMFVEPAGGSAALGEYARAVLGRDGDITVFSGSIAAGQGHSRLIREMAHDLLAVPTDQVRVVVGDSDIVPRGSGTFGSRSAQTAIVAVDRVLRELAGMCRSEAALALGLTPGEVGPVRGGFGTGTRDIVTYEEILGRLGTQALDVEEFYEPGAQTYPYGAYGAVVRVDSDSGSTELLRIVAVDDCGRVLDPPGTQGQVIGAIAQGLGQSMTERLVYDDRGNPITNSLLDYLIPTATQMPELSLSMLAVPTEVNELGVRGVGEAGTVGVPPAIVSAVRDAIGVTPGLPLTSERVWRTWSKMQ